MRGYILLTVALGIAISAWIVTTNRPAECHDLSNVHLVDPIVERLAIKRYPNDIVQQRLAIARWDSVRREVARKSANGWQEKR
jgi:hypothetical protein